MDTQIIKPIAAGDLTIERFTVEHFPGDALGIPTARGAGRVADTA